MSRAFASKTWINDIVTRPKIDRKTPDLGVVFHHWELNENGQVIWEVEAATGRYFAQCVDCGAIVYRWDVEQSGLGLTSSCLTNLDLVWRLRHPKLRSRCG